MKSGQITIFIIIGAVLLIATGFMVYIFSMSSDSEVDYSDIPSLAMPAVTFYESCLDNVFENGLNVLSMNAGYYDQPMLNYFSEFGEVPYYFYMGESLFPGVETFEEEMKKYIDVNQELCLNNFNALQGVDVKMDDVDSTVRVGEKIIDIGFQQKANVTRDGMVHTIEFPEYTYEARIKDMYEISEKIVENKIRSPKFINMTLLLSLIDEYDLQIDTLSNNNDKVIYVMRDGENEINNLPHTFLFAIRTFDVNFPPVILTERIEGVAGEEITGFIEAEDEEMDRLTYYVEPLFIVGRYSGSYNFTVEEPGTYDVNVTVSDGEAEVTETIQVVIHEN